MEIDYANNCGPKSLYVALTVHRKVKCSFSDFYKSTFSNGSFFRSFRDNTQVARTWGMSNDEWNTHLDDMHSSLMERGAVWPKFFFLVSEFYGAHVRVSGHPQAGQTVSFRPSGHPTVHFTVANGHVDFSPEPTDQHICDMLYQELDCCESLQDESGAASALMRMLAEDDQDEEGESWAWVCQT